MELSPTQSNTSGAPVGVGPEKGHEDDQRAVTPLL